MRFAGEEIAGLASHAIAARVIAQAPEGRQIFGAMTVAENLRLGAAATRTTVRGETLERVLTLLPLSRGRDRQRAGSLSSGE